MRPVSVAGLLAVVLLMTAARSLAFAQTVDPAYRFRTIRTPHFAIHFHKEAAAMAAQLADIAEDTWRRFDERPDGRAPAFTHVVLADQSASANGFATPFPRNTVVLYATAPAPANLLNPDDWLRTLFVHEFTHVVHLDRTRAWARAARTLFGRAPWTFPNMLLPLWQIEGWATFEESTTDTRAGRGHAGDFLTVTRTAARHGEMPPLDRVGGGVSDWPTGLAPYAYGLAFHEWLAERHGASSFDRLSERTAGSLPWLGSRAFRRVYGRSLSSLWRDFSADLEARASNAALAPNIRRLTTTGFQVMGPRYLPRTCETCPQEIAYVLRTADDRPGLHVVDTVTGISRRLGTRCFGNTTAPAPGDRLVFDQQELTRNVGTYSDLYAMPRTGGTVVRLTRHARLMDPDVNPATGAIVAVRHNTPGERALVVLDDGTAESLRVVASEPGGQFNTPRWSPDGRLIAAGLQRVAGPGTIAIVDVATGQRRELTGPADMQVTMPAWRPDGRAVIAAAARGDQPYELLEIDTTTGATRRLVQHPGGTTWPDVSPDGQSIVFVGYTPEGFDLFETPYPAAASASPLTINVTVQADAPAAPVVAPTATLEAQTYRPWSTLLPTFWTPILTVSNEQVRAGATVSGSDVLGYHQVNASIAWPIANRMNLGDAADTADWSASYAYMRWQPRIWAATRRATSFLPLESGGEDAFVPAPLVERTTEIGVQLPVQRLSRAQAAQVSFVHAHDTISREGAEARRNRSGIRAAWRFANTRLPGYAISPERGIAVGVASEFVRPVFGASGQSGTFTADVRAYLPGLGRHDVVAARFARGITWGDAGVRRLFVLGGGDASPSPGSLSSESAQLLRGFATNTFAGRQVATFNLDYRFPIARPQRGLGTWPFLVHSLHGAFVFDAGHAWTTDFVRSDMKVSIGAELSADIVMGFTLPVTITGGVARGHDGAGRVANGTTAYLRVGYAF
jgi:hypothetical protein